MLVVLLIAFIWKNHNYVRLDKNLHVLACGEIQILLIQTEFLLISLLSLLYTMCSKDKISHNNYLMYL